MIDYLIDLVYFRITCRLDNGTLIYPSILCFSRILTFLAQDQEKKIQRVEVWADNLPVLFYPKLIGWAFSISNLLLAY